MITVMLPLILLITANAQVTELFFNVCYSTIHQTRTYLIYSTHCMISERGLDKDEFRANEDVAWNATTETCTSKERTECFKYKENLYAFYK